MLSYSSPSQLKLFKLPFETALDPTNRWGMLAETLSWDDFARSYSKALCTDFGRPSLSPRVAIGAMIIQHKLNVLVASARKEAERLVDVLWEQRRPRPEEMMKTR